VIRRGEHYLLIRRAEGVPAPGAWCFPGGAVEPGESSAAAIVREVAEEVGLEVTAQEQVWEWTGEGGRLVLDWWRVEVVGGELRADPAEVAEVRWLTPSEIRQTPGALPGLLQFLNRFAPAS